MDRGADGGDLIVFRFIAIAFITLGIFTSQAFAYDGHAWKLSKINGKAWIEVSGREPMRVMRNQLLYPGQQLQTANRTRLLLTRGKERIQVGSNTILSLPPADQVKPGHTIISQRSGTIHLTVDKKNVKHFAVHTPYMVAAVKGTQFTVSLNDNSANLRVHEGIVQVTNKTSDEVADVTAGQSVRLRIASNSSSSGAGVYGYMRLLDRGQDSPEVIAMRKVERERAERDQMIGTFVNPIMSVFNGILDAIAMVTDKVISSLTAIVMFLLSPFIGSGDFAANVAKWVRTGMAGITAVAFLGSVAGLVIWHRRRTRYLSIRR